MIKWIFNSTYPFIMTNLATNYINVDLGDQRLTKRFNTLLGQLSESPSGSIPQATECKKDLEGAYRFFRNEKVTCEVLISAYSKQLELEGDVNRLIRYLVPSDSVELDYTNKRCAELLGPLTTKKRRGIILHNSMIMSESGVVHGLLDQKYIIRKDKDFGKSEERKRLPIKQKESYKWIEHFEKAQQVCKDNEGIEMVYIADREADIMELFNHREEERMHFLVRSQFNRCLKDSKTKLYEALAETSFSGCYTIKIIHPVTLKEREAQLHVRFTKQTIALQANSTNSHKDLEPVEVYAVEVIEINPPADIEEPIRWVLLTSLPVENFADALQIIHYYVLRWLIERFHYLLKSGGAKVEERNFKKPQSLKNAIATYSIVIMDAMKLRYLAENEPDTSIYEAGITPTAYKVLYTYAEHRGHTNVKFDEQHPPTIWEFCRTLGKIGGFNPSKRQPLPGLKILIRALEKLHLLLNAYDAFNVKEL